MPDPPQPARSAGGRTALDPLRLLLLVHVPAGLTCVAAGAGAMLSTEAAGAAPALRRASTSGGWSSSSPTATGMAALRWPEDAHLFALGALSFAAGALGYAARKRRWPGWRTVHIAGLSLSYIALLTAFYVDNGPRLPLWDRLPVVAFWVGPSALGLPLLARALPRHTRVPRDLRAACRALLAAVRAPDRRRAIAGGSRSGAR